MSGVRHRLFAFLAVLGLFLMLGWTSGAVACSADPAMATQMTMSMHHQHQNSGQPAPVDRMLSACPACLAVIPPFIAVEPLAPLRLAPIASHVPAFHNFDPGLDPPPPRA
jgi:hypothetical protein